MKTNILVFLDLHEENSQESDRVEDWSQTKEKRGIETRERTFFGKRQNPKKMSNAEEEMLIFKDLIGKLGELRNRKKKEEILELISDERSREFLRKKMEMMENEDVDDEKRRREEDVDNFSLVGFWKRFQSPIPIPIPNSPFSSCNFSFILPFSQTRSILLGSSIKLFTLTKNVAASRPSINL